MSKKLRDWVDHRTGYRKLLAPIRRRVLPGGPSWGYTVANCLLWLLVVELVTGFFLMSSYSPSVTNAWASVHYIEQSWAGAFIRGLHYWCAQAMIVLFAIHTIRVLAKAAFRAPRELIWISGLVLMPLVVVWAITGNPLSGTQAGYSQIEVEGNIIGSTPVIGPVIQRILIGGDQVGNLTLTHLYFLHVGLFPVLVGALMIFHIGQIYRHGVTPARPTSDASISRPYWPYQSVRNMIVFGAVFALLAYVAWTKGAPFDRPADPELPHSPRPEWYFLFLFELRAYFVGNLEFIATMVIPVVVLIVFLAVPAIDRKFSTSVSTVARYALVVIAVGGFAVLTYLSASRDWHDEHFQASLQHEAALATRARQLATAHGIPPTGAIELLRNDPETQGPLLFARHCASCHPHVGADGEGIAAKDPSAPNLHNFATRQWHLSFLKPDHIVADHVFGLTEHKGGEMAQFVEDEMSELDDAQQAMLQQIAVALAAEAKLESRKEEDRQAAADGTIEAGRAALEEALDSTACLDCHRFGEDGADSAVDLKDYGSYRWLYDFIANPEDDRFYGSGNDRMPAYAEFTDDPSKNILSSHEIDMLVRWLRGDDRELNVPDDVENETAEQAPAPEEAATVAQPKPDEVVEAVPAGEQLFRRKCARCHAHTNEAGEGIAGPTPRDEGKPNGAPNLYRFASREWITGLLDPERISSLDYFGNTAHSVMADDVNGDLEDLDEDEQAALDALIVALSAEAKLPSQADADQQAADDGTIERGQQVFADQDVSYCSDCHNFRDSEGDESAPDLTGYGSREWLIDFICDPTHKRFYGESNDRMPSYAPQDAPDRQLLTLAEIETIVDWLRGENSSRGAFWRCCDNRRDASRSNLCTWGFKDVVALITDPMLAEELIEQRRAAGVDKFDEVWDGVYVMAPIADNEHQGLVSELTTILTVAVAWPKLGNVYPGVNVTDQQKDWKQNYRCPDVAVFLNETKAENRRSHWFGGPDLAIEVVSPHDRSTEKLPFYAKVGTRELMLIGRNPWSITLHRLQGDKLVKVGVSAVDDPAVLASEVVPLNWRIRSVDGCTSIEVLHHDGQQRWVVTVAGDP